MLNDTIFDSKLLQYIIAHAYFVDSNITVTAPFKFILINWVTHHKIFFKEMTNHACFFENFKTSLVTIAEINNINKHMLAEKNDATETYFHSVPIILHKFIS